MSRLLILLIVGFFLWYAWQQIQKLPSEKRAATLLRWGGLFLVIVSLLLVATGRLHWIGAAVAALIPVAGKLLSVALRLLPMVGAWQRARGSSTPSRIKTRGLDITIDFRSGRISGQVLSGPHAGKQLTDMSESELREQLAFFRQQDMQSALLLNAYLKQVGQSGFSDDSSQQERSGSATMTRQEALQILGLSEGATREDIVLAHKRLIQKLHPDRGGNDYLASKVNSARDKLLG